MSLQKLGKLTWTENQFEAHVRVKLTEKTMIQKKH